jgi:hypothetical protein
MQKQDGDGQERTFGARHYCCVPLLLAGLLDLVSRAAHVASAMSIEWFK